MPIKISRAGVVRSDEAPPIITVSGRVENNGAALPGSQPVFRVGPGGAEPGAQTPGVSLSGDRPS
jgi:hypothetical protein